MHAKTTTNAADGTAERLLQALTSDPQTVAELVAATGLGRSTVGKQLAVLERDNKAMRTPGQRAADRWSTTASDRLRPGGLDPLVVDYVRQQSEPVGPVATARALGRSSGAVANCMARLAKAGELKLVNDQPRRYEGTA